MGKIPRRINGPVQIPLYQYATTILSPIKLNKCKRRKKTSVKGEKSFKAMKSVLKCANLKPQ